MNTYKNLKGISEVSFQKGELTGVVYKASVSEDAGWMAKLLGRRPEKKDRTFFELSYADGDLKGGLDPKNAVAIDSVEALSQYHCKIESGETFTDAASGIEYKRVTSMPWVLIKFFDLSSRVVHFEDDDAMEDYIKRMAGVEPSVGKFVDLTKMANDGDPKFVTIADALKFAN